MYERLVKLVKKAINEKFLAFIETFHTTLGQSDTLINGQTYWHIKHTNTNILIRVHALLRIYKYVSTQNHTLR